MGGIALITSVLVRYRGKGQPTRLTDSERIVTVEESYITIHNAVSRTDKKEVSQRLESGEGLKEAPDIRRK